ncbi:MAG TPA: DUF928 domain-containing protein [Allocoleopsis sp.]
MVWRRFILRGFAFVALLLTWVSYVTPSLSQSSRNATGDRRPTHRVPLGSRSPCADHIIALVPGDGTIDLQADGCGIESISFPTITWSDSLTLWVYIPDLTAPDLTAKAVLADERGYALSQTRVRLPNTAGVIGIHLDYPLDPNRVYLWQFTVLEHPQSPSRNPLVEGWVERVIPDSALTRQLETASAQQRIAIYTQNNNWLDAFTTQAELQRDHPNETTLQTQWLDLLNAQGLGAIAPLPLLNCCTPVDTNPSQPVSH